MFPFLSTHWFFPQNVPCHVTTTPPSRQRLASRRVSPRRARRRGALRRAEAEPQQLDALEQLGPLAGLLGGGKTHRKSHRSSVQWYFQWLMHFIAFIITWCFRTCFRGAFEPHSRLSHKEYWIVNCFRGDFAVFRRIDNTENRSIMHFREAFATVSVHFVFAKLSPGFRWHYPVLAPVKPSAYCFSTLLIGKWETHGKPQRKMEVDPLVNVYMTTEITILKRFEKKTSYFDWGHLQSLTSWVEHGASSTVPKWCVQKRWKDPPCHWCESSIFRLGCWIYLGGRGTWWKIIGKSDCQILPTKRWFPVLFCHPFYITIHRFGTGLRFQMLSSEWLSRDSSITWSNDMVRACL